MEIQLQMKRLNAEEARLERKKRLEAMKKELYDQKQKVREMKGKGQTKTRPIHFTVGVFDHKRQILTANKMLRRSEDFVYNNIYFTPDLTKNQRKQAYELRVERRSRASKGEINLKISRGKIVTIKERNRDEDGTGLSGPGPASGGGP